MRPLADPRDEERRRARGARLEAQRVRQEGAAAARRVVERPDGQQRGGVFTPHLTLREQLSSAHAQPTAKRVTDPQTGQTTERPFKSSKEVGEAWLMMMMMVFY